ncbi:GGDEF domain-containing protein [Tolumonas lignilytica]|uniref:GGDEF domain-containing protein n=1 Tax=Tolumonas lignilytica TaxID=1283284 RepID=UPI000465C946|nr:GGDEF domain-containing protein [Tolumonas lignilytica]
MRLNIAAKLAILLAVFALLISGVTALHVYHASRELLRNAAQERLLTTTQVLGRRIINVISAVEQDARRLADSPDAIGLLLAPDSPATKPMADELATQFTSQMRFNPEYYQIRLISTSAHGLERVRVDRESANQFIRIEGLDLQEKGHYPYVFEALKLHRGGVYCSPMLINHELGAHAGTEMPTLRISVPIFADYIEQPVGVIVVNVSMNGIFALLGEDLPKDHELYIANQEGEFIVHPNPAMAFAFDRGRSARVQDQFPETAVLFNGNKKNSVFATQSSIAGKERPVAAAFVRVSSADIDPSRFFVLGLAQSLDLVLASTRTLTTSTIPVILGFGCIAVVLAIWLARMFTRPLRQIAAEVRQFPEQSHAHIRLPVGRTDEVGVLARGLAAMQLDIKQKLGELDRQRAALHHQAHHDSLTGLPNRLLLEERFKQMLSRSCRHGSIVAVFFVDLDKFKMINDRYGHDAGDTVLKETAKRLRETVRQEDTVVRMGGDEFIILLEDLSDKVYLQMISNKLINIISSPIHWGDVELVIGTSIGIACAPTDGDNIDKLASCADTRMYQAKSGGGSRVHAY